ncbi:hypothetical protein Tco_0379964, partial [Tanacetum coccineum]
TNATFCKLEDDVVEPFTSFSKTLRLLYRSSKLRLSTPGLKTDAKREGSREEEQVFLDELERLKRQEKDATKAAEALRKEFVQETENLIIQAGVAKASSTNSFSTVSTPSSTNLVNTVSTPVSTASPHDGLSLSDP